VAISFCGRSSPVPAAPRVVQDDDDFSFTLRIRRVFTCVFVSQEGSNGNGNVALERGDVVVICLCYGEGVDVDVDFLIPAILHKSD